MSVVLSHFHYWPTVWCTVISFIATSARGESCTDEFSLRLTGTRMANVGGVEICQSHVWGSVCLGAATWRKKEAQVVCKALGYECGERLLPKELESLQRGDKYMYQPPSGNTVYWLGNVSCEGIERSIGLCRNGAGGSKLNKGFSYVSCDKPSPFRPVGVNCSVGWDENLAKTSFSMAPGQTPARGVQRNNSPGRRTPPSISSGQLFSSETPSLPPLSQIVQEGELLPVATGYSQGNIATLTSAVLSTATPNQAQCFCTASDEGSAQSYLVHFAVMTIVSGLLIVYVIMITHYVFMLHVDLKENELQLALSENRNTRLKALMERQDQAGLSSTAVFANRGVDVESRKETPDRSSAVVNLTANPRRTLSANGRSGPKKPPRDFSRSASRSIDGRMAFSMPVTIPLLSVNDHAGRYSFVHRETGAISAIAAEEVVIQSTNCTPLPMSPGGFTADLVDRSLNHLDRISGNQLPMCAEGTFVSNSVTGDNLVACSQSFTYSQPFYQSGQEENRTEQMMTGRSEKVPNGNSVTSLYIKSQPTTTRNECRYSPDSHCTPVLRSEHASRQDGTNESDGKNTKKSSGSRNESNTSISQYRPSARVRPEETQQTTSTARQPVCC